MVWSHRIAQCCSVLVFVLFLAHCGTIQESLTDQHIWRGYVAVTTKQAVAAEGEAAAITRAQQHYQIWRLIDDGKTTDTAAFCLPEELRGQASSPQGRVVLIRLVSKTDEREMIPLFFTKWDGVDNWFVNSPSEPAQCYRLTSSN